MRGIITVALLHFLVWPQRCRQTVNEHPITHIEIVSMNWSVMTKGRLTPSIFWRNERAAASKQVARDLRFQTMIEDENFLYAVDKQISRFPLHGDSMEIDVRVSCLLFRSDKSIDTLSFGPIRGMQINNKSYDLDEDLLRIVVEKLPIKQQEIIFDRLRITR